MSRQVRTTRAAADYQEKDEIEHILDRPDMYIGSTEFEERDELLLNINDKKLYQANIKVPQGVERLFLEILSNAGDNADNSRRANVNPGSIAIYMDRHWIKVRNGGLAIPVEESKSSPGKLVPEIIFGKLRSSSNYDPNVILMGAGKNGFGAKLTNVYSVMFNVSIGDNINKKLYSGTWEGNMRKGPRSEVKNGYDGEAFVEISWLLDFKRFNMEEYSDEAFGLFARYAADFSLTCKIPVWFNEVQLNVQNIRDFARLNWEEEECNKAIVHYEWPGRDRENPNGVCPFSASGLTKEKYVSNPAKAEYIPMVEIMIIDTPDNGRCLSYVNGMYTMEGGVHVHEVYQAVGKDIIEMIHNIHKSKKDKENRQVRLTVEDISKHISVIINCRLPDPKYTSQSKTRLAGPKPHIQLSEKTVDVIKNWNIVNHLIMALEAKMHTALKKTNGGRTKHISLDAGEDANDAGTDKSDKCVLYLVEGKSAAAYPKKRIVMSEGGKDFGGYYPLRGKFLNVRNASILSVAENKEVKSIKAMIGLREGLDYTQPENLATLRYGWIMICVDADSDGFHIASLLINYINQFYPGLLLSGRVAILRTPVVRIFQKNKLIHRFYNNHEFETWEKEAMKNGTLDNCKVVYYKGLGKSDDDEIQDDLTTAPVVTIIYDDQAASSLTLAFDKTMADQRKEWIARWREVSHMYDVDFMGTGVFRQQMITNFINRELIDYTKDALFRAIPCQDDGLKRSHRQALFAALKYFNYGRKNEMIGVSRFANYAANETNYHHGEASMCDTVIKMAQDFIGSNNLPWFKGKGQFGTRSENGADAASPRYLSISLPKYASLLYDEELINCVPRRVVETDEVEPLFVPAVIPMHLVNGVIGIATGYSTYIPCFNYYDIINWCKSRCSGIELRKTVEVKDDVEFKPWFKGFKGTVIMKSDNAPDKEVDDPEMKLKISMDGESSESGDTENTDDAKKVKGGVYYKTRGIYKIGQNKERADLIITEIPIGMSILKYRKWIEQLVKDKLITDFRDKSTTEIPYFEIKGYNLKENPKPTYKNIFLEKSATLNNVTLIDAEGYPTRFGSINQVMEVYAERMLKLYELVKENRLKSLIEKMTDLQHRITFIQAVVDDKIKIVKRPKADILKDMAKYKPAIPEKYLKIVKAEEFSNEEIEESRQEFEKLRKLYDETLKLKPENLWYDRIVDLEKYLRKEKY